MGNVKMNSSRRKFLKSAATLAGASLGYGWLSSSHFVIFGAEPKDKSVPWYGIGIDIKKCIGCGNCVVTCPSEALKMVKVENETVPPEDSTDLYKILAEQI